MIPSNTAERFYFQRQFEKTLKFIFKAITQRADCYFLFATLQESTSGEMDILGLLFELNGYVLFCYRQLKLGLIHRTLYSWINSCPKAAEHYRLI